VLRYAGLVGGLDAVVSVSGPGHWYYRDTEPMRRVHFAVEHRLGRFVTRRWLKTRISPEGWKLVPVPPAEAAAQISPVPLLIVHGDKDHYFPPEHARELLVNGGPRSSGSCLAWVTPRPLAARARRPHRPLDRLACPGPPRRRLATAAQTPSRPMWMRPNLHRKVSYHPA
jgi:hypothetical protein